MTFWDVALLSLTGQFVILAVFILLAKRFDLIQLLELKMAGAFILYAAGIVAYATLWSGLGFWSALLYGAIGLFGGAAGLPPSCSASSQSSIESSLTTAMPTDGVSDVGWRARRSPASN